MQQQRHGQLLGLLIALGVNGSLAAIQPAWGQVPKEIRDELSARQQKLAKADKLFDRGKKQAARKIYRKVQEPWTERNGERSSVADPIMEVEAISPAGQVFWRQAKKAWKKTSNRPF
ncbi:MAG: hypothetical protein BRC42_16595 [Cyanobacteria bacterium QS_1_48_34]|jgi:hypothetical protein|nr:MAG: hypothetical protein BRC42_16595 [Cyanobacteria bacterium QS_1_48_34]